MFPLPPLISPFLEEGPEAQRGPAVRGGPSGHSARTPRTVSPLPAVFPDAPSPRSRPHAARGRGAASLGSNPEGPCGRDSRTLSVRPLASSTGLKKQSAPRECPEGLRARRAAGLALGRQHTSRVSPESSRARCVLPRSLRIGDFPGQAEKEVSVPPSYV